MSDLLVLDAVDPAYADLKAQVEVGEAVFLGERYLPDGTLRAAFRLVRAPRANSRKNPSIRVGSEFFTTALRDYADWEEKWWREAIQNAVDAGARNVLLSTEDDADGNRHVFVADDGRGMSLETLLDKFLVLGGSQKFEAGAHGGFGKAKELLILPWLSWRIHTGSVVVEGQGMNYEVLEGREHQVGVLISVVMPPDRRTSAAHAQAFVEKCHLPRTQFVLRDEQGEREIHADLRAGKTLREFPGASLHLAALPEGVSNSYLFVRTKGASGSLYMFDRYVGDGSIPGKLPVVEVTGRSIDLLTANRDGFRDQDLRYQIEGFLSELAADKKSALREKKGLVKKKYKGAGKFIGYSPEQLRAIVLGQTLTQTTERLLMSPSQIRELQDLLRGQKQEEAAGQPDPESSDPGDGREYGGGGGSSFPGSPSDDQPAPREHNPLVLRPPVDALPEMLDVHLLGDYHAEAALRQVVWEPDFYLINEADGFRVPKKFYPEQMAPRVLRTLKVWTEMCRFVLIQLACAKPFGVGFYFSTDTRAVCLSEGGEDWLLLNPFVGELGGKIFQVTSKDDLSRLYALAVHEVTHLAENLRYHDESFSSALTENFAKTGHKIPAALRITRAVR